MFIKTSHSLENSFYLAALLFITPVCLFYGNSYPIWLDEAGTLAFIEAPFENLLKTFKLGNSPPLYYFFLKAWIACFGIHETALRSLSGFFSILNLAAIYYLGYTFNKKKSMGIICSLLYLASPLALYHARNARPYALLSLCTTLSTILLFNNIFLNKASKINPILYFLSLIAGIFTHYWFFFVMLAQLVCFLTIGLRKKLSTFLLPFSGSLIFFAVFWLNVFLSQSTHAGMSFLLPPCIADLASTLCFFAGSYKLLIAAVPCLIFLSVWRVTCTSSRIRILRNTVRIDNYRHCIAYCIYFIILFFVPFFVSQKIPVFLPMRYTIVTLLPCVMITGIVLARSPNRTIVIMLLGSLLLAATVHVVKTYAHEPVYSDRSSATYIISNASEGDIFVYTCLSRITIDYYLQRLSPDTYYRKFTFPREVDCHPTWLDFLSIRDKDYQNRLSSEARHIVDQIQAAVNKNPGAHIWLFYGRYAIISNIIKGELDSNFRCQKQLDLRGSSLPDIYEPSFTSILLYTASQR